MNKITEMIIYYVLFFGISFAIIIYGGGVLHMRNSAYFSATMVWWLIFAIICYHTRKMIEFAGWIRIGAFKLFEGEEAQRLAITFAKVSALFLVISLVFFFLGIDGKN
ncbi:MAG: hypothetical protein AABX01_02975 [Candidatus Micrarchaeota archaeon]